MHHILLQTKPHQMSETGLRVHCFPDMNVLPSPANTHLPAPLSSFP